ncbi:MAG: hypothetical protein A2736_02000 [Candidatus Yanofskybacteria bacterium RIFCSPHIGHO2_01_FULL_41_27]|uniref:Uncharacterized protein n=2 Tax=Candidatus Yanofskyibacteriota TaxID=1752733 RepID=A0A1F8HW00_9BACT|nr:MAG: hypothetical protein A2736_02000 [Candidatus Yanofskybacteria bacterium RIFCSPHIGHO2_01_FULL_41_27]OGN09003.1 MAG: hypothetical protein A3C64_00175 [Candidatus Yanofskybacteria bacterium RIFCSPHIGHO2_02_FULL_41_12]OGN41731.1 MAG: hypothetical protein A2606_00450 [Candidatus Yanofskybacteria bacterium RIFOXYD1_FULL_42_10]
MNSHLKSYLIILIVAVAAIFGFLQWQKYQTVQAPAEKPAGIGSDLYQQAGNPADNLPAINPLENKPDTNPLTQTNPYSNIKTNPFK